jgi:hypothetical protein
LLVAATCVLCGYEPRQRLPGWCARAAISVLFDDLMSKLQLMMAQLVSLGLYGAAGPTALASVSPGCHPLPSPLCRCLQPESSLRPTASELVQLLAAQARAMQQALDASTPAAGAHGQSSG